MSPPQTKSAYHLHANGRRIFLLHGNWEAGQSDMSFFSNAWYLECVARNDFKLSSSRKITPQHFLGDCRVLLCQLCSMVDEQERDESVKAICSEAQKGVLDAIPEKWRIRVQCWKKNKDARGVPEACGVLTPGQLDITSQDATSLLPKLHAGELNAVEVTEAFCARAAVAHQMTNCLTAFFPDEAREVARQLDEMTRKPVGPLHGLPICVKVCTVH